MAVLNMRLAQPAVLIDISRSVSMSYLRTHGSAQDRVLQVGAAVTQSTLEWRTGLDAELPLLNLAIPWISHFQIRNRGTVCGSLAHADPSAELPLCLLALQGEVLLQRSGGERVLRAQDFFTGMLSTARQSDELLAEVRFPMTKGVEGFGFKEFAHRHGDYALCAVAVVASQRGVRIAVGGVSDRPMAQDWPHLQGADLNDAFNDLAWATEARDDLHLTAVQRRHLVRNLGRQAWDQAMAQRAMKEKV
jgi:2-furoyl-CoA dehydrogenase FAD binding subunit